MYSYRFDLDTYRLISIVFEFEMRHVDQYRRASTDLVQIRYNERSLCVFIVRARA